MEDIELTDEEAEQLQGIVSLGPTILYLGFVFWGLTASMGVRQSIFGRVIAWLARLYMWVELRLDR